MSSSGLVRPSGSSARDGQVTSKAPTLDESRETVPWPPISGPSQCAFAVRVVAMSRFLRIAGASGSGAGLGAVGAGAEHLDGVGDVHESVLGGDRVRPLFHGGPRDLLGAPARAAHQMVVVL